MAKLEWSEGALTGMQGRDARAIATAGGHLHTDYLRRHAAALGLTPLLDQILAGDA